MAVVNIQIRSKHKDLEIPGIALDIKSMVKKPLYVYSYSGPVAIPESEFNELVRGIADYIHTTNDVYRCMSWVNKKRTKRIYVDAYCNKLRISTHAFIRGMLNEVKCEFFEIKEME